MGTVVDDAVHVQVQVVKYRNVGFRDRLVNARIPLTQPAVELRYPCTNRRCEVNTLPPRMCLTSVAIFSRQATP